MDTEVASELQIALEEACLEAGVTLSSTIAPRTSFWLWEDNDAASTGMLAGWLAAARKRSFWPYGRKKKPHLSEGLDLSVSRIRSGDSNSVNEDELSNTDSCVTNLKERLQKATELDISLEAFSWDSLLTVCRTEHMQTSAEDETCGSIEVTVNSGGVVYFALFENEVGSGEAAACMKFAPSRLATQSELLGLELARHLGVLSPQARVVYQGSREWTAICGSVEKVKEKAKFEDNELGENTCGELLEALNLSRCLLLMGYVNGRPLAETPEAFLEQETAERTAATFGRVLLLDLVLRNEDRFPCQQLGWRGNPGNLLATEKLPLGKLASKEKEVKPFLPRGRTRAADRRNWNLRKQLRDQFDTTFGRGKLPSTTKSSLHEGLSTGPASNSPIALSAEVTGESGDSSTTIKDTENGAKKSLCIVAIDSGVPRRPPSLKADKDRAQYSRFVELLLNDESTASEILQEVSGSKLGVVPFEMTELLAGSQVDALDQRKLVKSFQQGFREGVYDMQDLRTFLLKLFRKLNQLLKEFVTHMASVENQKEKEERPASSRGRRSTSSSPLSTMFKSKLESLNIESDNDSSVESPEVNSSGRSSHGRFKNSPLSVDSHELSEPSSRGESPKSSPRVCRETWHGKLAQISASGSYFSNRLTLKLKDVNKFAKVDEELSKQLDLWDQNLRVEGQKICSEQGFTTGFLDHSSSHSIIDSYELKVRLDHLLERMALIVHGVQTERPSCILKYLYIGGALAARSIHTLQYLGITHVLCLCPSELSIEEDYVDMVEFKSFQVRDVEDENISQHFGDACNFIDSVEEKGGVVLVHCFEGKSRSAAVILAYLMIRKGQTLLQAWALLKAVHPRAQPNDGFMKILVNLDKQLYGMVSMDWHQKRPQVRMCPVCGRSAGISNTSLRHHLRKSHSDVTRVPWTTVSDTEVQRIETSTAPLENVLSVVGL